MFFISADGRPYSESHASGPRCSVSVLFGRLCEDAGVKRVGRSFSGLRTTFYNLAPSGEWELERKIIMGHAQGTIGLDSYLEDVGLDRLRHVVNSVWEPLRDKFNSAPADAAPGSPAADGAASASP